MLMKPVLYVYDKSTVQTRFFADVHAGHSTSAAYLTSAAIFAAFQHSRFRYEVATTGKSWHRQAFSMNTVLIEKAQGL